MSASSSLLVTLAPAGHSFRSSAGAADVGPRGGGAFVLWSKTDGQLRRYSVPAAHGPDQPGGVRPAAVPLEPTATGETGGGRGAAALALSSDGSELLVLRDDDCDGDSVGEEEADRRWTEAQRLHVFDPVTLQPARASVAICAGDGGGRFDDIDVAASSCPLVAAGPGLACLHTTLRRGENDRGGKADLALHLVDTATGRVAHSVWDAQVDGQVLFVRSWAPGLADTFIVIGTVAGRIAVLRVDRAACCLVREAEVRAGDSVNMLEVGPARARENAAFAVATSDGEPCVRRFSFVSDAEGCRLVPAGEYRCDDIGDDVLMRSLVLAESGGVGAARHGVEDGLWWWPPGGAAVGAAPLNLATGGASHDYHLAVVARDGPSTVVVLGGGALLTVTDTVQ